MTAAATLVELSLPVVDADLLRSEPFVGEEEYWGLTIAVLLAQRLVVEMAEEQRSHGAGLLRAQVADGGAAGPSPRELAWRRERLGRAREANAAAAAHLQRLRTAWRERLRLTEPTTAAPRMVRIAKRANLSESDQLVLAHLVANAAEPGYHASKYGYEVGEVAALLRLTPAEFFGLLHATHPFARHEIVHAEEGSISGIRGRDLRVDAAMLKFLRGLPLAADESASLADGLVLAVLHQETGADGVAPVVAQSRAGSIAERKAGPDALDAAGAEADLLSAPDAPDGVAPAAASGTSPRGEDEFDIDLYIRETAGQDAASAIADVADDASVRPYQNDLEYVNDCIEWIVARGKLKTFESEESSSSLRHALGDTMSRGAQLRELRARERAARARIEQLLGRTRAAGGAMPRAEGLAAARGLTEFEKWVLVLAAAIRSSPRSVKAAFGVTFTGLKVQDLLNFFTDSLEEQVRARRHFYRDGALVRDGLITLGGYASDVMEMDIAIDRRMTDFLLGLETEASSLVEGSHLYTPNVDLDRVVLPEDDKRLIVETVEKYPAFQRERRRSGLDDLLPYGRGIVLLFHGKSGTGKTMMANALATRIGKRILLANWANLGEAEIRLLFREAKLTDSVLFFDECDGIFLSRDFGSGPVGAVLTEIQRHDGLCILATNRPYELDEAMAQRISISVEFRVPDAVQREAIWRAHIPTRMRLEPAAEFAALAYEYELTGGLIKNAVLAALAIATARDPVAPVVRPEDLEEGARRQLRGRYRLAPLADATIPRGGLSRLVVPPAVAAALRDLIGVEKSRRTLVGQWGFAGEADRGLGASALFHGLPGTGKSLAAEAVAYELGQTLKRVNAAQVLSMWVSEGAKNIQALFREAQGQDAVLLFDEADALFATRTAVGSSTDRYANVDTSILLQEIERYPGVVILTTNLLEVVDDAFNRRLRFIVEFPAPDAEARVRLWRMHLPSQLPVTDDISLGRLAELRLTGSGIHNAVVKAASRAALRPEPHRRVAQADLLQAAEEEQRTSRRARVVGFRG